MGWRFKQFAIRSMALMAGVAVLAAAAGTDRGPRAARLCGPADLARAGCLYRGRRSNTRADRLDRLLRPLRPNVRRTVGAARRRAFAQGMARPRAGQRVGQQWISPITDLDHWGVVEKWAYPDDGYGDSKTTPCSNAAC